MPYCPNCGSEFNTSAKYCRACGFSLEVEPKEVKTHEAGQKLWKKAWFLAVIGVLLVGLIIGAVLLINKHNSAQDIELASARATLNIYLGYAVQQDKASMWDMVYPDSKVLYKDSNDFASNNGITNYEMFYELNNWDIESAEKISSWKTYSNVVSCKVSLDYKLNTLADMFNWAFLGGVAPSEQKITTTLFLIKVGDQWEIYSEHSSSSVPEGPGTSSNGSQTNSSPTTGNETTIPTITAGELISDFNANGVLGMKYKDQVIKVTGVVNDISSSSVDLAGPHSYEWVSCEFESSQLGQLANLSNGETITIQGTCTGGFIFGPTMDNCKVVG
jgi:ribosomal protein L37E